MRGSWRANARKGEPQPERGTPQPPPSLTAAQRAVWDAVCEQLDAMGVLTVADWPQLERYARMYVQWRQCQEHIDRFGMTYQVKSDDPTYYVMRLPGQNSAVVSFETFPEVKIARDLDKALKEIEAQFGLTPAARVRLAGLGGGDAEAEADPLTEFLGAARRHA
jgi:P27 family predicted phage terminase small subunit